MLRKAFFKTLASINKVALPRMSKKDLTRLTTFQKAIVAFRYWVTTNAID